MGVWTGEPTGDLTGFRTGEALGGEALGGEALGGEAPGGEAPEGEALEGEAPGGEATGGEAGPGEGDSGLPGIGDGTALAGSEGAARGSGKKRVTGDFSEQGGDVGKTCLMGSVGSLTGNSTISPAT